jgi:uncharacterized protein with PhoU and TrkA domain
MGRIIEWALDKFTNIRVVDYESLLGIAKGYTVSTFKVSEQSWLAYKTLREARLREEGVIVLGIYRPINGKHVYIGAPKPDTKILPGDELVVYGPEDVIADLATRVKGPAGDWRHMIAIEKQKLREKEEAAARAS